MKNDAFYLQYMLEIIGRIERAATGGKEEFIESELHQDAVLRNLHTMTETSQRVSARLKTAHPEIEWRVLAAFRNVLVHDYLGIDLDLVWTVISEDIPALKVKLTQLVSAL